MHKHTYLNDKGQEEEVSNRTIYCNFVSQFGNNIFQYIYACLLNEKVKGQIWIPSKSLIRTRPCTFIPTASKNICKIIDAQIVDVPKWTGKNKGACRVDEEGVDANPDLDTYEYNNKPVLLTHYFQEYRFYKDHKEFIKEKLGKLYSSSAPQSPLKDDVVIHIRGRDCGWPVKEKYFIKALDHTRDINSIYIITDDPGRFNVFSQTLEEHYKKRVFVLSQNSIDDFKFIMQAKKIIICGSTFSWWAAWLSEAETICMPNPSLFNNNGDKRLFVDEDRYQIF